MFARYSIPEQLVSDNGPQFVLEEFSQLMKQNIVKHIKIILLLMAKRNDSFASSSKQFREGKPLDQRLENFFLLYRATPHATTGAPPCKLFLGRNLRTRLHLLQPQLATRVCNKQAAQKQPHNDCTKTREFFVGQEETLSLQQSICMELLLKGYRSMHFPS